MSFGNATEQQVYLKYALGRVVIEDLDVTRIIFRIIVLSILVFQTRNREVGVFVQQVIVQNAELWHFLDGSQNVAELDRDILDDWIRLTILELVH